MRFARDRMLAGHLKAVKRPAYGSIYLDDSESPNIIWEQLKSFEEQNPDGVYFDVIGRDDQIDLASELITDIYTTLRKKYTPESIYVTFTPDYVDKEKLQEPKLLDLDFKENTTLESIVDFFVNNYPKHIFQQSGKKDKLNIDINETRSFVRHSQHFLLDVKLDQEFYDGLDERDEYSSRYKELKLPFNKTLLAFEKPLSVMWQNPEQNHETTKTNLLGVGLERYDIHAENEYIPLKTPNDDVDGSLFGGNEGKFYLVKYYRARLIFLEPTTKDETVFIGNQWVVFGMAYEIDLDQGDELKFEVMDTPPKIWHVHHYPCDQKKTCKYRYNNGQPDSTGTVCQEIHNRNALVETLIHIVHKIHTTEPIKRKKKSHYSFVTKPATARMDRGWPYTKGNLPKNNYVLKLGGVRYEYDKDDINTGSGVKHRYRYDVRTHPRIIGDRIIWVKAHRRGKGEYIRKVYANSDRWYMPYLWNLAERVTGVRVIEIVAIRAIKFLRKWFK